MWITHKNYYLFLEKEELIINKNNQQTFLFSTKYKNVVIKSEKKHDVLYLHNDFNGSNNGNHDFVHLSLFWVYKNSEELVYYNIPCDNSMLYRRIFSSFWVL